MPFTDAKKLLLVDDHEIVRAGVRQILASCDDMVVAAEAASGAEALVRARSEPFDAVLLDLSLPDRSGIEVLRRLRIDQPELPVLMLSMHAEDQYAVNVLKAGASGYISKDSAPDEIRRAIRTVLAGQRYVSMALAQQLASSMADGTAGAVHEQLSPREFEVFGKLAAGQPVSQIAEALFLSVKTVSTHRARILEKMHLKTNADLTYYAIKNKLID